MLVVGAHFLTPAAHGQEGTPAVEAADAPAAEAAPGSEVADGTEQAAATGEAIEPVEVGPSERELSVRNATEGFLKALAPMPESITRDALGPVSDELAGPVVEDIETGIAGLRKKGFVPMKSLSWLHFKEAQPEEMGLLLGIVELDDGRAKHIEVRFDSEGLVKELNRPDYKTLELESLVESFLSLVRAGKAEAAWKEGSAVLKEKRDAATLEADFGADGLTGYETFDWSTGKGVEVEGGFRLDGTLLLKDGSSIPFYAVVLEEVTGCRVLDIQSSQSVVDRITKGDGDILDHMVFVLLLGLILGLGYIMWSYARGLTGSPYELYLLFFTKVTEYSAYGAASITFMFYLREDIGLSDIAAGSYYGGWSTALTFLTMAVGAVCDAIGIKKTLLVGAFGLMFSRAVMPFLDGFWSMTILGATCLSGFAG